MYARVIRRETKYEKPTYKINWTQNLFAERDKRIYTSTASTVPIIYNIYHYKIIILKFSDYSDTTSICTIYL